MIVSNLCVGCVHEWDLWNDSVPQSRQSTSVIIVSYLCVGCVHEWDLWNDSVPQSWQTWSSLSTVDLSLHSRRVRSCRLSDSFMLFFIQITGIVWHNGVDSQENHWKCCHQLSYIKPKMHQFSFDWGSAPDTAWGAYSDSPGPLAGFNGPISNRRNYGKEGQGGEGKEESEKREGRRGEERGVGKVVPCLLGDGCPWKTKCELNCKRHQYWAMFRLFEWTFGLKQNLTSTMEYIKST